MSPALRVLSITGLLVGAMDIISALIMATLRGSTPMRLLQFVASGLLGRRAFEGGAATAALGLALHFVIAFGVVTVFYFARRKVAVLRERPVAAGLTYGLVVFAVMNLVVLPLSAAKTRHALVPDLIQIAIHLFVIGLPTSLLIRRFSAATAS
ncbi:MAG: hypothetical protein M3Z64_03360 [Verrucomicrobiota bacterium]|nr:hypothetical protein [Verrucomicrobiota bacterium]